MWWFPESFPQSGREAGPDLTDGKASTSRTVAASMTRPSFALAALALFASACTGTSGEDPTVTTSEAATTIPQGPVLEGLPLGSLPEGPSALSDRNAPEFPPPLVDVSDIRSGGPPPDGIPPIDDPQFISVSEADAWLADTEAVVVIEIDGDARAYPAQILIWHEIVNDVVGGVPVAVTYCPLCNSAVAYGWTINGVVTTFGTSGSLYSSALVMYDRATESLWTHYDGTAVVGMLAGTVLKAIPSPLLSWAEFKATFPDGLVLDRDATGFTRDYGRNPYDGYDDVDNQPFLFDGTVDDRAAAMRRVVGVTLGEESVAWALDALVADSASATSAEVGGVPIVIFWKAGQSSALDDVAISTGQDVGSVGVFVRVVERTVMEFEVGEDGEFVDASTGTSWDITGRAVAGALEGSRLERVVHLDTFWFAWSTYRPGTRLVTDRTPISD